LGGLTQDISDKKRGGIVETKSNAKKQIVKSRRMIGWAITLGVVIGAGLGAAIGAAFGSIAQGIPIGMIAGSIIGVAVGAGLDQQRKESEAKK
jgi:F0F1-type ATP synthase assembly protein I